MKVHVRDVTAAFGRTEVLREVDLEVPDGSMTAIVGPNGSGKSTLLRVIYGGLRPDRGTVHIGDTDVLAASPRRVAALRGVVPQQQPAAGGLRVADVVATARQHRWYERETAADVDAIGAAMERCGAAHLLHRRFDSLSGGERQRVLLARALAQGAPVLLLDEPTNHLDPGAQLELLAIVRSLETTRIIVLHDLDHALTHADRVTVLHEGRVLASGEPEQALSPGTVQEAFGLRSAIAPHPLTGRPHLTCALPDRPVATAAAHTPTSTDSRGRT